MKKILIIFLTLMMTLTLYIPNVYAQNNEVIILSGDGTFENPYEIEDNDNEIVEFINQNYERLNSNCLGDITPYGLSSSSTTVDNNTTISSSGAYWRYQSGGGTTVNNGSLVYTLIEYVPHSKMGDMCALALKGATIQNSLRNASNASSTSAAKQELAKVGISSTLSVVGFLPGIGYLASAYGGISMCSTFITACNNDVLANTQLNQHHLMIVHFKTSYQGSWYKYSRVEESTTKTHPQIPQNAYGVGKFTNSSRLS